MQTRPYIIWTASVTVILLFIVALWLMLGAGATIAPITSPSPSAGASINQKLTQRNVLVEARLKLLDEMKISDDDYKMKVPIEFFGKVLDQNDGGVVGAKVEIGLCPPDDTGEKGHIIITGDDGRFSLTGTRGKLAFVNVYSPQGYTCGDMGHKGDYNYAEPDEFKFHVPDRDQPVVFRLWKYEKAEPLNRRTIYSSVKTDGTVGWFDLKSGVAGESGGLGVCVVDHLPGNDKESQVTYKLFGGEGCSVFETQDDPMFTPPAAGFRKEIIHEIHWKSGVASHDDPGEFRFYYLGADGTYAAVEASLRFASETKCDVFFYILQNPSGARNVEYDTRLEIKQ